MTTRKTHTAAPEATSSLPSEKNLQKTSSEPAKKIKKRATAFFNSNDDDHHHHHHRTSKTRRRPPFSFPFSLFSFSKIQPQKSSSRPTHERARRSTHSPQLPPLLALPPPHEAATTKNPTARALPPKPADRRISQPVGKPASEAGSSYGRLCRVPERERVGRSAGPGARPALLL